VQQYVHLLKLRQAFTRAVSSSSIKEQQRVMRLMRVQCIQCISHILSGYTHVVLLMLLLMLLPACTETPKCKQTYKESK
jgi:hypothetical protein